MSAHVGLIVTGKCEQKGLCDSLARVFPEARFELLDRVESFTSADVRELPESRAFEKSAGGGQQVGKG